MAAQPFECAIDNDLEIHVAANAFDPAQRKRVALQGGTLTAFLAWTPAGTAIHASLSVTLSDLGEGEYYGVIQRSDLTAQLAASLGQEVFLRLQSTDQDLGAAARGLITATRRLS